MAEYEDREHYIPLRKSDLVNLLAKDAKLSPSEREPFRQFCKLVSSVWHFEYLETLEQLKDAYAPFDPDTTCKPLTPLDRDARPAAMDALFDRFVGLMGRANFKRMTKKDIDDAVEGGATDWGVNMHVDFDVFERLELFSRGAAKAKRTKRGGLFTLFKVTEKQVDTYQRLVLLVKLRKSKRLPEGIDTDAVFLKVFKDIPKLDLEMVLPGTKLQMPWSQKGKMSASLVGTFGYGIFKVWEQIYQAVKVMLGLTVEALATTASAATSLIWGPALLLGGYAYKQYAGYQRTRATYSQMLTESLYFQNLDNNSGVITQVMDEAEEQECRETILAYYYLWKYAPPQGWNSGQLDDFIEMELEGKLNVKIDFEVDDAIGKLEKLGVVRKSGENYVAVGIEQALERLDHRWDNYFKYNKS